MDDLIGKVTETGIIFEWKICDFFSCICEIEDFPDSALKSPCFYYKGISWYLLIQLEDYLKFKRYDSDKYINLYLFRESNGPSVITEISLALRTVNGDKMFERVCTKNFEKHTYCHDFLQFIFMPELKRRMNELLPSNVLTVLCTMKTPKSSGRTKTSKIMQDFQQLFRKQENSDVVLRVKGENFPAHKAILAARSSVISAILKDHKKKELSTVDINDCDPSSFVDFLYFLYCGELENISEENAFSLFTTANKFDIPDLKEKCLEFIKRNISLDTFCETFSLSLQHKDLELTLLIKKFFIENVRDILYLEKWEEFIAKSPMECNELFMEYAEESVLDRF